MTDAMTDGSGAPRTTRELLSAIFRACESKDVEAAVALTAFGRSEDKVRAMKAGFDAHVAKPIDTQGVVNAIVEAFRRAQAPSPSLSPSPRAG